MDSEDDSLSEQPENPISTVTESDIEFDFESYDSSDDDYMDDSNAAPPLTEPVWTTNLNQNIEIKPFSADNVGPTHNLNFLSSELAFFHLLFTEEFIQDICQRTNKYAIFEMERKGKIDTKWDPVTYEEMNAFIGIHIIMGIHILPKALNYWSTDDGVPIIRRTMPQDRFDKISKYFCISDRRNEPAKDSPLYDRLYKLRPLLEMLNTSFSSNFKPDCEITIGERKSGFLQYFPMQPMKRVRGVKVWIASEPVHGYTMKCVVHTGKANTDTGSSGKGHAYDTVMDLAKPFFNKYHHIYFHKYFNSFQLLQDLLQKETYALGTFQPYRRDFPKDLTSAKLKPNESILRQSQEILSCIWKGPSKADTPVCTMSTNTPPLKKRFSRRYGKKVSKTSCPLVIKNYFKYLTGVDQADRKISYYTLGRSSNKRWTYLFWFFTNVSIVNARILFYLSKYPAPKQRVDHLGFRLALAKRLIGGFNGYTRVIESNNPKTIPEIREENMSGHRCVRMPNRKKKCVHCDQKGRRTQTGRKFETVYGCNLCNIHLCRDGCFTSFHAEKCGRKVP